MLAAVLVLAASGALGAADLPHSAAERKAMLASRSRAEVAEIVRAIPQAKLIELGKAAVRELGVYRARMRKQERVGGKLLAAQTMAITVREQPRAVRMEVTDGPKKGR